jgi:hypothetical protein
MIRNFYIGGKGEKKFRKLPFYPLNYDAIWRVKLPN